MKIVYRVQRGGTGAAQQRCACNLNGRTTDKLVKTATLIAAAHADDTQARMQRLKALAWLLDASIPLPGGWRIGIDAILGLLPGVGDAVGAVLSAYIVNEARALGAPKSVLWRMLGNVAIETVIGSIPFAGDLFDAAFKANLRNLRLLERYQYDPIASRRSSRLFVAGFSLLLGVLVLGLVALPVLAVVALVNAF